MFASTTSATLIGVEPRPVEVEVRISGAAERFHMVGLPDTAIREARDRVRAAFEACGYEFPRRTVTVNLAPADLPKAGSAYDLPIALALLTADKTVPVEAARVVSLGELALDGQVRPTRGCLAAAKTAAALKLPCLVPTQGAAQAAMIEGADVRPVANLIDAVRQALSMDQTWTPGPIEFEAEAHLDLADVRGQALGRRALEISAAGGHHLLMVGSPGCGKTMLARRLPGILPDLTPDEQAEVALIWEAGDRDRRQPYWRPPFRAPHHTASTAGLLGGGTGVAVPGEVSLAHLGVLFLDELGEFPSNMLDALRQPLEEGALTISRRGATVRYPARAQVVAATNPCPCGYRGDRRIACKCDDRAIQKYQRKLSGPLLDRFDLRIGVSAPDDVAGPPGEASGMVAGRIADARRRQLRRGALNRSLSQAQLDSLEISREAKKLLGRSMAAGVIGPRGYDRVRRVARTIADLAGSEAVEESHVAEAIGYRRAW